MAMVKQPPHILITTPESLYLMLTSPRAREMLRTVRTVIVDEIHTLVGEKRGVHLSLSLERLEHLAGQPHPAHRSLRHGQAAGRGGALPGRAGMASGERRMAHERMGESARHALTLTPAHPFSHSPTPPLPLVPRAVTIVDTGYRKPLDLQVVTPVEDFRNLPGDSVWPSVIPQVLGDIMRHRSHADLLQQPPPGRAHRRPAQRADRRRAVRGDRAGQHRGAGAGRHHARPGHVRHRRRRAHPGASRQHVQRSAPPDGGRPEGGQAAGAGRHQLAGAGHRHRRRGSGRAAPIAQERQPGVAARRPLGPPGRPDQPGPHLRHLPRGPRRGRGGGARHVGGRCRADRHAAQSARCAGPADRRHGRRRDVVSGGAV